MYEYWGRTWVGWMPRGLYPFFRHDNRYAQEVESTIHYLPGV